MSKLVTLSLLFLAWAYYEATGGEDRAPAEVAAAPLLVPTEAEAERTGAERLVAILGPEAAEAATADPAIAAAPLLADPFPVTVTVLDDAAFEARTGLAPTPNLDFQEIRQLAGEVRVVSGDGVNMRSGPGTGHGVVGAWPSGTEALLLGTDGGWSHVRIDGTEGWMWAGLLEG